MDPDPIRVLNNSVSKDPPLVKPNVPVKAAGGSPPWASPKAAPAEATGDEHLNNPDYEAYVRAQLAEGKAEYETALHADALLDALGGTLSDGEFEAFLKEHSGRERLRRYVQAVLERLLAGLGTTFLKNIVRRTPRISSSCATVLLMFTRRIFEVNES